MVLAGLAVAETARHFGEEDVWIHGPFAALVDTASKSDNRHDHVVD